MHNDAGHVAANINWRVGTGGTTGIKIVGPASNPVGVAAVPGQLYDGATLHLTLNFGFVPERYWRGVFRMAYLAAFNQLGYAYIISPGALLVRRIIDGTDDPPDVILQAHPESPPRKQAWLIVTSGADYLTAILRLNSHVTRYLTVLLPVECSWEPLIALAAQHRTLQLTARPRNTAINVRFTNDPVKVLRETKIPAGSQ